MKTYEEREKVEAFNYFKKMGFQAKLIENNSEVCILDWRAKRTFNLSERFIVDKRNGDLIITGDSGCATASWFHEVTVSDIYSYVDSIYYFIEKLQCIEKGCLYYLSPTTILEALEGLREEFEEAIEENNGGLCDAVNSKYNDIDHDIDELREFVLEHIDYSCSRILWDDDHIEIVERYLGPDIHEWIYDFGRELSNRIYLWSVGFQMAVDQLKETDQFKEKVLSRPKVVQSLDHDENIVAWKIWTRDDIAGCLEEKGFEPSEENIDVIHCQTDVSDMLSSCTDGDWQCIYTEIDRKKDSLQLQTKREEASNAL